MRSPYPGLTYYLTILFRPAIQPLDRSCFENEVQQALEDKGLVCGGGTAMDGEFSDISVAVADLDKGLRLIREVLRRCQAPQGTVIISGETERAEHPVYE